MSETMINSAIEYINELFRDRADGHGAEHSLRVYRNAMKIAEQEKNADLEIVALAALLHDTDDHKLFDTKNNANARAFLNRQTIDPEKIERICDAINSVSFSQNRGRRPETIEGKIVQDADRLDALGAIGIARTFAFGGMHGRSMDSNIQHFYDKLLLLKDEMNTESGKEMAKSRHAFLEDFLEEYKSEL
ncbi:MAG: HD domain-containing protein [Parasporobacterium sp.]|nr:HD domain-containing protein [Parasporobacterium sp.]